MATLNTSSNGPAIAKAHKSILDSPLPTGQAASSPTYGQWAVYSVSTPLVNAFQQDSASKESVLKLQSTGEGELVDLIEEFSDGRIQFAFVKVKDPNTGLPKNALICWCGEGVPERTKGYFTSHSAAVSKFLHGYHVQVSARSDRDLSPEGVLQKVADSSGSKYSAGTAPPPRSEAPKPAVASKPVFTPSRTVGSFKPLAGARKTAIGGSQDVDEDGWGADAPPVTRTQLEKVQSAYQPTKVNMKELLSQKSSTTAATHERAAPPPSDVVKGEYRPIGKVDIAELRRQARESGQAVDDRPEPVKGSYQPVGKVDLASIRAKAQGTPEGPLSPPARVSPAVTGGSGGGDEPKSLAERSAAFKAPERLTTLPKPKVSNKFGAAAAFTGTKAPLPGGLEAKPVQPTPVVGSAARTFADQGGKTPAQLWAEKKAKERGGVAPSPPAAEQSPIQSQTSGQGGWKSSYTGKSWAPVQTTHTGRSSRSAGTQEHADQQEEEEQPSANVGAIRERFAGAAPMGGARPASYDRAAPPPPLDETTKPVQVEEEEAPRLPVRPREVEPEEPVTRSVPPPPPRSPTPEPEPEPESPIRVAMPVSRSAYEEPAQEEEEPAPRPTSPPAEQPAPVQGGSGLRAVVQYDYEKTADDELELREGEFVTNIDMVDEQWWSGVNARGEQGLFPSNYVELVEGDADSGVPVAEQGAPAVQQLATATALYDYEAAEDNEIGFPEGAKIVNIEFLGDDWWHGEYEGQAGLFPSNYVQLDDQ